MSDRTPLDARTGPQTVKAQLSLRDLLLSGRLPAGRRVSEAWAVAQLGVSRTPVRAALAQLAEEGFLEALPTGGYAVRRFTRQDAFEAIEIRGVLEGLAVRRAAERGLDSTRLGVLEANLAETTALIGKPTLSEADFAAYVGLNQIFHEALAQSGDSRVLERQIERAAALPFAHPSGFVMAQAHLPQARLILTLALEHHRAVVDAIKSREGGRAEALMREHARLAGRNLTLALEDQAAMDQVAGARLFRAAEA